MGGLLHSTLRNAPLVSMDFGLGMMMRNDPSYDICSICHVSVSALATASYLLSVLPIVDAVVAMYFYTGVWRKMLLLQFHAKCPPLVFCPPLPASFLKLEA